LRRFY